MAFIHSFKNQSWLFPPSIEELIPEDHVCFLVESFVESLDFSDFNEKYNGVGHPAYHPQVIIKLLVMGMLDRIRSSRRLARNTRENVVYLYLAEKLTPEKRIVLRKVRDAIVEEEAEKMYRAIWGKPMM